MLLAVLSLFIACPATSFAKDKAEYTMAMTKKKKGQKNDLDPKGVRLPPRPIIVTISSSGIQSDINPDEIISYEVWDIDGNTCQASFCEEHPFCQYIFNAPGEYQINMVTDDYVFVGYISTLNFSIQ